MEDLYNKILLESRNPTIYTDYLQETLDNKIILFLVYLSFAFNLAILEGHNKQSFFDYIFKRIEIDLREFGLGDMNVNKKMKIIITKFYSILIDFNEFEKKNPDEQKIIIEKYFKAKNIQNFVLFLINYSKLLKNN